VQLQFTIAAAGTVRDAVVIDADPKGYFEDAAVTAVSRWKYQPNVKDGRASGRQGVRVVLRFDLEGG
jgi:periplasmic protein TonB